MIFDLNYNLHPIQNSEFRAYFFFISNNSIVLLFIWKEICQSIFYHLTNYKLLLTISQIENIKLSINLYQ